MKEREKRKNSRYITGALLGLVILAVLGYGLTGFIETKRLKTPEGIEKRITGFAQVVIPFGKYQQVRVLDGEKGIAAVKEKDGFVKLIDFKENLLLDLKPFISIGFCQGRYMALMSSKGWSAIDYEDALNGGKIQQTDFNEIDIPSEGRYYVGKKYYKKTTDLSSCRVMDYRGNVIYESPYNLKLTSKDGYAVVCPENKPEKIVELKSGKTVFTMGENENYRYDTDNLWIIEKRIYEQPAEDGEKGEITDYYCYFLDRDFRPALGGKKIKVGDISADGRYMTVSVSENGTSFSGVMNEDGKIIFSEKERKAEEKDRSYREIIGNTVIARRWDGKNYALSYIDIGEAEKAGKPIAYSIGKGTADFCMMDFEDGIALVNREKDLSGTSFLFPSFNYAMASGWYDGNYENHWMEKFEWGFVDKDRKRICDLMFSGAFPSDNRYAAVSVSDMWGVIKFK